MVPGARNITATAISKWPSAREVAVVFAGPQPLKPF
jgi:hypothetical protein